MLVFRDKFSIDMAGSQGVSHLAGSIRLNLMLPKKSAFNVDFSGSQELKIDRLDAQYHTSVYF